MRVGKLEPHELTTRTHALAADFDSLGRGFFDAHRAELEQLRRELELPPAALRCALLLLWLPAPAGRPSTVGHQLTTEQEARLVGCSEGHVKKMHRLLGAAGLILRFRGTRKVRHLTRHRAAPLDAQVDREGNERHRSSVVSVTYPTPALFDLFANVGWTRRARARRAREQAGAGTVRTGVVGKLLEVLRSSFGRLAGRCARMRIDGHPIDSSSKTIDSKKLGSRGLSLVGSARGNGNPGEERPSGANSWTRSASQRAPQPHHDARRRGAQTEGGRFGRLATARGWATEAEIRLTRDLARYRELQHAATLPGAWGAATDDEREALRRELAALAPRVAEAVRLGVA